MAGGGGRVRCFLTEVPAIAPSMLGSLSLISIEGGLLVLIVPILCWKEQNQQVIKGIGLGSRSPRQ
jgi:hypothetical protein